MRANSSNLSFKTLCGILFLLTATVISLYFWLLRSDHPISLATDLSSPATKASHVIATTVPERPSGRLIGQEEPVASNEIPEEEQTDAFASQLQSPSPSPHNAPEGVEISVPTGERLPLGMMEIEETQRGAEKSVVLDEFLKALPSRFAREVSALEAECRRTGALEAEYRRRWQEAANRYDQELRALLGEEAYLRTSMRNHAESLDTLLLKNKK